MTRARVKAIHDKVNSLLSTLNLDTTLDGVLLHSDVLYVLRYDIREDWTKDPQEMQQAVTEEEEGKRRVAGHPGQGPS
jgi:hypothetical protein